MIDTTKLQSYSDHALGALRISSALIFTLHGSQKLLAFPTPKHQPELLSLMGIGGLLELVGGLLLLVGLFTRPVAFVMSGMMAVAYWMFHAPNNLFPTLNGGDAAILYSFVFFFMVFAGPGRWSLDGLRRRRAPAVPEEGSTEAAA